MRALLLALAFAPPVPAQTVPVDPQDAKRESTAPGTAAGDSHGYRQGNMVGTDARAPKPDARRNKDAGTNAGDPAKVKKKRASREEKGRKD